MANIYELKTSTITCLVSTNVCFILDKLFNSIEKYILENENSIINYVEHNGNICGLKIQKKASSVKNPFQPHQVAVSVSILRREVKLMIFKSRIKICGCTSSNDAVNVVSFLWKECISEKDCFIYKDDEDIFFTFEEVMINKPFVLPFTISKIEFNTIMNKNYINEVVCFLDVIHHNYVNLTIQARDSIKCLLILTITKDLKYCLTTKTFIKNEKKGTTFMIYDRKVIVSGRNIGAMELDYEFLKKFITDYKEELRILEIVKSK